MTFVKDQYRHCKPILALGAAAALLRKTGIPDALPSGDDDPGLIIGDSGNVERAVEAFAAALGKHRHFVRETDPPLV